MRNTLESKAVSDGFLSHGPLTLDKTASGGGTTAGTRGAEAQRAPVARTLITRDRVAAWWLPIDRVDAVDWPKLEALLVPEERERAARFHFERDRLIYFAAHAMLRGLLSYCLGGHPHDWRFSVEEHGKPELICTPGCPRVRVNLSHTRGLAAAALTIDHDIGVDVEWGKREVECEKLAERVFAPSERRVLAATCDAHKVDTFLTFWTLKEAYVKAIGKGLSQPLDAFFFDPETATIAFDDTLVDDASQWLFRRYRPEPDYLMAIGLRHPAPSQLEIDARPVPLDWLTSL